MSIDLIIKQLQDKVSLEAKVIANSNLAFQNLKKALQRIANEIARQGERNNVQYTDRGDYEVRFMIGSDMIVYILNMEVFSFDQANGIWKSSYVQENKSRSFCGSIYVYNFLSDSFKYDRDNDLGYLVARIFINEDNHFFVEGKRQLGFLYNDFANATLGEEEVQKVVESTVIYSLDFDPFNPPYDNVKTVTVREILDTTQRAKIATGKRLGFRFSADTDSI